MYCPKCDMDFVDGVTVCTDCGTPLVNKDEWLARKAAEKADAARKAAEKEEQQIAAAGEAMENLTDEDREALEERAEAMREMMREPSVYVNEKDKYDNNQSAAVALLIVGIIIAAAAVMMWIGILPDLGILMKIALTGFAVLCLVGALVSAKNAKKYKGEIVKEENRKKEIIERFLAEHTKDEVMDAVPAGGLTEEELAIERMNYIQDRLSVENDIPDKAFAAMLAENIYDKMFEE